MLTLLLLQTAAAKLPVPLHAVVQQCGEPTAVAYYPPSGTRDAAALQVEPGVRSGAVVGGQPVDLDTLRQYGWVAHLPGSDRFPYRWFNVEVDPTEAMARMEAAIAACDILSHGAVDVDSDGLPTTVIVGGDVFEVAGLRVGTSTEAEVRASYCATDCVDDDGPDGLILSRGPVSLYFDASGVLRQIQNRL